MYRKMMCVILIAILMFNIVHINVSAVEVELPEIYAEDNFDSYTSNSLLTTNDKWIVPTMNWKPNIETDSTNSNNKVLIMKRSSSDSVDGGSSNKKIYIGANTSNADSVDVSYRIFLPDNINSGDNTNYNSISDSANQGGFSVIASDGTEIFYTAIFSYSGKLTTFYTKDDGNSGQFDTALAHNVWHNIKISFDFEAESYKYYVNNNLVGTYKIRNSGNTDSPDVNKAEFYLHRNCQKTLIGIDDIKISGNRTVQFNEEDVTLDYTVGRIDYETRTVSFAGTTTPYFAQEVTAQLKNEDDGAVVTQNNVVANTNGSFEIDLSLDDELQGWYSVTLSTQYITTSDESRTKRIYVASGAEALDLVNDFNNISETVAEAKITVEKYIDIIADEENKAFYAERADLITSYFCDAKTQSTIYLKVKDVSDAFEEFAMLSKLSVCEGDELISILEDCEFLSEFTTDDDFNAVNTDISILFAKLRGSRLLSCEAAKSTLKTAMALAMLNNATEDNVKTIVLKYNSIFGLNIESNEIKKLNQTKLYSSLIDKNYSNIATVKTDFEAKAKELEEAKDYELTRVLVPIALIEEDFDDYNVGENLAENENWTADEMKWRPVVGTDFNDAENQALFLTRAASDETDGGDSNMSLRLVGKKAIVGPCEISYRIYFTDNQDSGDGTMYNSLGDTLNQGGFTLEAEDGTQVFYSAFYANNGSIITLYTKEDGSSGNFKRTVSMNEWHTIKILIDFETDSFEYILDNTSIGTFKMTNSSSFTVRNIKGVSLYLKRDAQKTLIGIDELNVSGYDEVSFVKENITFDYTLSPVNYTEKLLNVNGKVSPYFAQNVSAKLTNDESGDTAYAGTTIVNADGDFEFDISTNGLLSGWYTLLMNTDYITTPDEVRTEKVYIASETEKNSLVSDFNLLSNDVTTARQTIGNYVNVIATYDDAAEFNENGEIIAKYFIYEKNNGKIYNEIADVTSVYTKAVELMKLTRLTETELTEYIKDIAFLSDITADEDFEKHKDSIAPLFALLRSELEGGQFYTEEEVVKVLRTSIALAVINDARRGEIKPIVVKYNDVLVIDINSSDALKVDQDLLYANLYNKNYTNPATVRIDFVNGLNVLLSALQTPSNNTSNTAGGRDTAISSSVPAVQPNIEPVDITVFSDIQGNWAEKYILSLAEKGIISGYADGTYGPQNHITRAEFVTILFKIMNLKEADGDAFADVTADRWYAKFVYAAYNVGYVAGADGFFLPDDNITRQDIAAILARAAGLKASKEKEFMDSNVIAGYAKDAVNALYESGVISGYEDGSFRPTAFATRAEVAKLIDCFIETYTYGG